MRVQVPISEYLARLKFEWSTQNQVILYLISASLKLLWINTYHSTDFEVHRNWLAITNTLPLKEWYYESTSEWTLDYPPFFAYFEYLLSMIAKIFDPKMLVISKYAYVSSGTILFQRLSVILTEIVFLHGCSNLIDAMKLKKEHKFQLLIVVFLTPGILFVDSIHFQYNGLMYGIQLLSCAAFYRGQYLLGGALFATLLNFKHIYMYQAPAYFIYLLAAYCNRISNLVKMGMIVILVFALSIGPFLQDIPQLFSRLFPFKRGLCHAYWAPNFWSLYAFADRLLVQFFKLLQWNVVDTGHLTRGLIGDSEFAILPNVPSFLTFILTIISQLPALRLLWRVPTPNSFMKTLIICGMSSFIFGWHVHEKAVLLFLIPLAFLVDSNNLRDVFKVASSAGTFALFPLLFHSEELATKVSILLVHLKILGNFHPYYIGFALVYVSVGNYEFLPLMLTSVYCALGIMFSYIRLYWMFYRDTMSIK